MLRPVSMPTPDGRRIAIGLPSQPGTFRTTFEVYDAGSDKPRLQVEADAFVGRQGCLVATGHAVGGGSRYTLEGVFPQIGVESYDISEPECMSVRRDRRLLPDSTVAETHPGFLELNYRVGLGGYAMQAALPAAAGFFLGSIAAFATGHTGLGVGALLATVPCALMAASNPVPM